MLTQPLRLEDLSDILCSTSMWVAEDRTRILILSFSGHYRDGSRGTPDAKCMAAQASAALAAWEADGIVFDFRDLAYRWGNGLLSVFDVEAADAVCRAPGVIVYGPGSIDGLSSLCSSSALFTSLELAVAEVHRLAVELAQAVEQAEGKLRAYILIREDVPPDVAIATAARAGVAAHEHFPNDWQTREWLCDVFRSIVCRVSEEEYIWAKTCPAHVVLAEPALGNREVAIVFAPRAEWPERFLSLRQWC